MLTEKEQKLVKRYAFFSELPVATCIAAGAVVFVWGVFWSASSIAVQSDTVLNYWLALGLSLPALLLLALVLSIIGMHFLYNRDQWLEVVDKVHAEQGDDGTVMQPVVLTALMRMNTLTRPDGPVVSTVATEKKHFTTADAVARLSGTKVVKRGLTILFTTLIACSVCGLFSIMIWVKAKSDLRDIQQKVADSVDSIQDTFNGKEMHVSLLGTGLDYRTGALDPDRIDYSSSGYRVVCYLNYEEDKDTYLSLTLNNDGEITDVEYYCLLSSPELSNEEQYAHMEETLEYMHAKLLDTGVDFYVSDLENVYLPSRNFEKKFMEADLTGEDARITIHEGDHLTYRLSCYSGRYSVSVSIKKPDLRNL